MSRRLPAVTLAVLALAACAPEDDGESPIVVAQNTNQQTSRNESAVETHIEGMEFFIHDRENEPGSRSHPLLRLRARDAYTDGAPDAWRLENIEGEIRRRDTEPLSFSATGGRFNQTARTMSLDGPLRLWSASYEAEFPNLAWDPERNAALSEGDSRIRWNDSDLRASEVVLMTDNGRIRMREVSGTIELTGVSP